MATQSKRPFACKHCGHGRYTKGEIRAAGGMLSSWFDIDTQRFSFVACESCQYTEFYKVRLAQLGRVVDFLLS